MLNRTWYNYRFLFIGAVALAYFFLVILCWIWGSFYGEYFVIYLPSGLAAIFLLRFGIRYWSGIFLGALPAFGFMNLSDITALAAASGYILFPIFIWAALRFHIRGVTMIVFLTAGVTTMCLIRNIAGNAAVNDLLSMKALTGIITITVFLLAAAIAEREKANLKLKKLNESLEQLVTERTNELSQVIKERLNTEKALRYSEEKYRSIVENSADGFILADIRGNILEWNHSMELITGFCRNETLDRPMVDVILGMLVEPKESGAINHNFHKNMMELTKTGRFVFKHDNEIKIRCRDGISRVIQVRLFHIKLHSDYLIGGIVRDITGQKLTEDKILGYMHRLEVLREIDRAILETPLVGKLARTVITNLKRLINCRHASIVIYDNKCEEIILLRVENDGQTSFFSDGDCLTPDMYYIPGEFYQDEIQLIDNLDFFEPKSGVHQLLIQEGIHAFLSVPLSVQGELIGAIHLGSEQSGFFYNEQVEIVRDVANGMAIAVYQNQLDKQIRSGREQMRQLARRVVSVQEEERRRVSQGLHDEAGQALTALKINLELIARDFPDGTGMLEKQLNEAVQLTDSTMEQIRRLAKGLRPPSLDTVGLNLTLEGFCREFAKHSRINIRYYGTDLPALPDEVSICLYRILQESLNNACKHARASLIRVKLELADEMLYLVIEDNGCGFNNYYKTITTATGIGLLGIRERLTMFGGCLDIQTQPDKGTRLSAKIPLWEGLYD